MRTNDIAKQSGVHPNTVRLYEAWGYISPVPRLQNGYRQYSEIHLKQMLIARLAFRHEFILILLGQSRKSLQMKVPLSLT